MDTIYRLMRLSALLVILLLPGASFAQGELAFNTPMRGEIAPGQSELRGFSGKTGQVISLRAESAGTLDPVLTLLNADGEPILSDDDFAYPESSDSLLQAITLPYTGRYSVQVSGFADTAGQYTLTASEGYSVVETIADLATDAGWRAVGAEALEVAEGSGGLSLAFRGVRAFGAAFGVASDSPDLAAFADVVAVRNPSGWSAGLALRRVGDTFYAFQVNSEGRWRFVHVDGDTQTIIRDWTSHPAIVAGQADFRLGAFAKGSAFDFFYDGAYIGTASDDTLSRAGSVGLIAGTISSLESDTQATFANLVVTTPLVIDGAMPIPQQVAVADGPTMALTLSRRHVVQGSGQMVLTVPEVTVNYVRPGVNRFMLGQGTQHADFAFGGMITLQQGSQGATGCGMVVRYSSETSYALAYLDGTGAYGLSLRDGETFAPGLFGENPALRPGIPHQLLVIASGPILYFYVDGQSAGQLEVPITEGQVGAAVVNYEAIDTTCRLNNVWLWRW